jgi:hypothetical protein
MGCQSPFKFDSIASNFDPLVPEWIHIAGSDPQTGETIDKYGCSDSFRPRLMIENFPHNSDKPARRLKASAMNLTRDRNLLRYRDRRNASRSTNECAVVPKQNPSR